MMIARQGRHGKAKSGVKMGVGLKIENILEMHLNDYKPVNRLNLFLFQPHNPTKLYIKDEFYYPDDQSDKNKEG